MQQYLDMLIYILKGVGIIVEIYIVTALFSIPISILMALGKISKYKIIKKAIALYTWIFRGTPLLLQLFFVYYGLPNFGIKLSPFQAASITFIINYAAYLTEIVRAGIESIDKGQYEAAKVLGMGYWKTMTRIVLPQTIKRVLPPFSNEAITLVKDTALISVIGLAEILRNSKEIVTREFTIAPFIIAALLYLRITSVIVLIFKKLEKNCSYYN